MFQTQIKSHTESCQGVLGPSNPRLNVHEIQLTYSVTFPVPLFTVLERFFI